MKNRRGFTLVETMVAITIITLSILAPFDAIERVVSDSRIAKDQLIAASLAQEGLEYIRFVRDNNYLANPGDYSHILDGLTSCENPNVCTIDPSQPPVSAVQQCIGGSQSCTPLYVTSSGLYNESSSGTKTLYTRYIQIGSSGTGSETATTTITWTDHGTQTMQLVETYYDWI